jgi:GT2 family glycosyltransferase
MKESLVMSERAALQELIHLLNRRYHEQWLRAEHLQHDLNRMRRWSLWPIFELARRVKRWLRPAEGETRILTYGTPRPELLQDTLPPCGRVSIIIPFKDRMELLRGCLGGIQCSSYRRFEIVLVNNGSSEPRTERVLRRLRLRRGVRVVDCPGVFNFSRLCNQGAARARGDFLLFLNNDTEVLTPDWLERLLVIGQNPGVGAVAATLLYPDRTIQHAGIFPRADGNWDHAYRGRSGDYEGDRGELPQVREVPAVTAACMLMRQHTFQEMGGFDERLPVTFGDVDLCLRMRARGLLAIVTPHARLMHFESITRGCAPDRPGEGHLVAMDHLPFVHQ